MNIVCNGSRAGASVRAARDRRAGRAYANAPATARFEGSCHA